jgi:hypothetical protein
MTSRLEGAPWVGEVSSLQLSTREQRKQRRSESSRCVSLWDKRQTDLESPNKVVNRDLLVVCGSRTKSFDVCFDAQSQMLLDVAGSLVACVPFAPGM